MISGSPAARIRRNLVRRLSFPLLRARRSSGGGRGFPRWYLGHYVLPSKIHKLKCHFVDSAQAHDEIFEVRIAPLIDGSSFAFGDNSGTSDRFSAMVSRTLRTSRKDPQTQVPFCRFGSGS